MNWLKSASRLEQVLVPRHFCKGSRANLAEERSGARPLESKNREEERETEERSGNGSLESGEGEQRRKEKGERKKKEWEPERR